MSATLQATYLAQSANVREVDRDARDDLIVSLEIVDGTPIVLSRFGDDTWLFPSRTTNQRKIGNALRFSTLPAAFRGSCKQIYYRFVRRGRDGQSRPSPNRLPSTFTHVKSFVRHLHRLGIKRFADVTAVAVSTYLQARRSDCKRASKPLTSSGLMQVLSAVELVFELSQYTDDPMAVHPWPGTSATRLAGLAGPEARIGRGGKTPLIPDDVFCTLFQAASDLVQHGDKLLDVRDEFKKIDVRHADRSPSTIWRLKKKLLAAAGMPENLENYYSTLTSVRTACYIVVASLSGCRNHELLFLETNACKKEVSSDGTITWWMHSTSTKTGAGACRWMVPEAAVKALKVMDRWAAPFQAQIRKEIQWRRAKDPQDHEIADALLHSNAIFLGGPRDREFGARVLTGQVCNRYLKEFAARCAVSWNLASHQFRRKFANYAARSKFGDLRYLREHFKHWSLDMTLGYALNGTAEIDLFLDIASELDQMKDEVVATWLNNEEKLSGGYGRHLVVWRGRTPVTLFKNRAHMVRSVSSSTALRSNGHAWCTADDNLCVGNDMERTRCSDCGNAVIDFRHAETYQGLLAHLEELATCDDIGPGGKARVERDIARCRSVLSDLGCAHS